MSIPTHPHSLADYTDGFAIDVQPTRITNGGVAVVTAEVDGAEGGTYTATWIVEGPVPLSDDDMRVVLLGATIVTGGQVELTSDDHDHVPRNPRHRPAQRRLVAGRPRAGQRRARRG